MGHSVHIDLSLFVHVISRPEFCEIGFGVRLGGSCFHSHVIHGDFLAGSESITLGYPEMTGWQTVFLSFGSVVSVHGFHECVVGFAFEPVGDVSHVSFISAEPIHPMRVGVFFGRGVIIRSDLNILVVGHGGFRLGLRFLDVLSLSLLVESSEGIYLDIFGSH